MRSYEKYGLIPQPVAIQAPVDSAAACPLRHTPHIRRRPEIPGLEDVALKSWQRDEAYRIDFLGTGPAIACTTLRGQRNAQALLKQIVSSGAQVQTGAWILDYPRYQWRGLSIDIVRHFFGVDTLKDIVELMASLRLNTLHLHLSDDQGWRIDIPDYPELVAASSSSAVGGDQGGYVSAQDWEELRTYAHARGVQLVPEVDVPGHTNAAKHAIVGLNSSGEVPHAYTGIEVGFSSLEWKAPQTQRFLGVIARTLARVSDGAVHIGGDESHATPEEEYAQIVTYMAARVRETGRAVVAWQESAHYLKPADYVQVWDERLDMTAVVEAARRGVQIIMSPGSRAYLDMKYNTEERLGLTWMGTTELRQSLEWDPATLIPGVSADAVAGVEATVWTETIRTPEELSYMLLPRLAALAEVAWTGSGVGQWDSFATRIAVAARSWEREGRRFHHSPGVIWP